MIIRQWVWTGMFFFAVSIFAQDEYVIFNDFEMDLGTWTGWAISSDYSAPDEPHHGGVTAAKVEVENTVGWQEARFRIADPVDGRGTDELHIWVYSTKVFRLRVDLGVDMILGFRNYTKQDLGQWKELVFWFPEEKAALWDNMLSAVRELRLWINPDAASISGVSYPKGFTGTIYFDDITLRKHQEVKREYLPLIGFNSASDEALVRVIGAGTAQVDTSGAVTPTEGTGCLAFTWISAWGEKLVINLRGFPQFRQYDRVHFDLFLDGPSSDWAAITPILKSSWTDANGKRHTVVGTDLEDNILGEAIGNWKEFSGQYGPMNSTGYTRNGLLPELAGAYDDPNGTITLTFATEGGDGVNEKTAYIDNVRLSRPVGTFVQDWELR